MLPPERAFCPLWPLPLVFPWPELSPHPSRLTRCFDPGRVFNSCNRILVNFGKDALLRAPNMFLLIVGFAGNGGYLTSLPRSLRISWRRRNPLRASMVALTTLAWLLEPSDLANTSLIPAASTT